MSVCNNRHDVLMISMYLSNIAILNIHDVDYMCVISGISKSEATNLKKSEKWNIIKQKHFLWYIKMGKEIITFGDILPLKKVYFMKM